MSRNALVIGHHEGDHAGNLIAPLRDFGFAIHDWRPSAADAPPVAEAEVDVLIVMGGIMGAHDEDEHPWLTGEFRLVERHLRAEKPVLGLCLGGQILARVLGARVYRAEAVEIGFHPIDLTGEAPALAPLATGDTRIMQWHKDAFDLPEGARHLARSEMTPNQAFAYGDHCLALQGHPEADLATVRSWVAKGREALEAAGYDVAAVLAGAAEWGPGMERAGAEMMNRWLDAQFDRPATIAASAG